MTRFPGPAWLVANGLRSRILSWALILTGAALIFFSDTLVIRPSLAYACALLFIACNAWLQWGPAAFRRAETEFGLGILNLLGATLAFVVTGQSGADFYLMYFLVIAIALMSRDLARALLSSVLIVLFHAIVTGHQAELATLPMFQLRSLTVIAAALLCADLAARLGVWQTERQRAADLYRHSRSEAEMQRVLLELGREMAHLDVPTLMKKLTDRVLELFRADISDARVVQGDTIKVLAVSGAGAGQMHDGVLGSRSGRFVKMIETRRPVVAADIRGEAGRSGSNRYAGVCGYLAVPFRSRAGEVIGALRALTYEPRSFRPEEVALLQQLADGAAILLENTRLIEDLKRSNAELQQTSREQRSLQNLLADIFSLQVDGVLHKVAHETRALLGTDVAWLHALDDQARNQTFVFAGAAEFVDPLRARADGALAGLGRRIVDQRGPVAVRDLGSESRGRLAFAADLVGWHGFLGTPVLSRAREPLAVLAVMSRQPRNFSPREIELIGQFAHGAAIAIENGRTLGQLRDRTSELQKTNARLEGLLQEQSALREIFRQINLLDLDELLTRLAEHALTLLRVDHVQVRLVNESGEIQTFALAGSGAERFREQSRTSGKSRSTWIIKNRQALMIRDINEDMYFGPGHLMHEIGVKAYLGVPLLSRDHQGIGVLIATSLGERSFTNDDIALAEQLAAGAAVAIENARLFAAVQEASKKIEEAFRVKTAFMNTMAHELRTPLSIILGTCELSEQGIYGELTGDQAGAWGRIRRNAQSLLELVNEILDLVRLESKKVTLQIETLPVGQLLADLIAALRPLATKKELELTFALHPDDIAMRTDRSKLRMVLQNLIANAIKYTDRGRVAVTAELLADDGAASRVAFSVSDTGIGLKPEDIERIFEAFYMVDGVDRQKYPGTGLGLCIVQRLVELLAGRIEVQSEFGKGSTFTVILPVHHPQTETAD